MYFTSRLKVISVLNALDELDKFFTLPQFENIFITGDLIANLLATDSTVVGYVFESYNNLAQIVDTVTRITSISQTLLDVFFISDSRLVVSYEILMRSLPCLINFEID